jgi:type I restriction enzyme R subunit
MTEADTETFKIEPKLKKAGWNVVPTSRFTKNFAITPGEIRSDGERKHPKRADYILIYKNRKLAVIEAKPDNESVSEGVAQAKEYATKLRLDYTYSSNGDEIYEICLKTGKEGIVKNFPTPDELWDRTFGEVNEWLAKFNNVPFEIVGGSKEVRYYQEISAHKVVEAIANNKQRILLTLATGTGKTLIAFHIAWKLFKSRWTLTKDGKRSPRILFLTDRNFLADQALLDFNSFQKDALIRINPSEIKKEGKVPKSGAVFFTIYQTFMSGPNKSPYFYDYESDFFDLVIVDECHRGGANDESSWREILDHFKPAVHLGLTATPKRDENTDTYEYFGKPVYEYSLKEGIEDGFLTPYKVNKIESDIDEYQYTPDDDVLEGEVEEDKVYTEAKFNKEIFIEERERRRVVEMLSSINPDEKTIVFCANQDHALIIRNLINQEASNKKPNYCVRVTADDKEIGNNYLRTFRDNEKTIPTILTTSQKLSTGLDALNVRNIVLMRVINSMIEFKQIIGRGTRVYDGKNYFTIIDFVKASELFYDPDWDGTPLDPVKKPKKPEDHKDPIDKPEPKDEDEDEDNIKIKKMVKIKLADGKERQIQTVKTTLFFFNGKTISAQEFIQLLYNTSNLPEIFKSEEELRELWKNPITRSELLKKLENKGFPRSELEKVQEIINARNSDLFDVLEFIRFNRNVLTREERVLKAKDNILNLLSEKQKDFINFILSNYIKEGIDELDIKKLPTAIRSKYNTIEDAKKVLGKEDEINRVFIDFQKHLYHKEVA